MEIRFCSVCNESIPDGEFDAAAIAYTFRDQTRSQHLPPPGAKPVAETT